MTISENVFVWKVDDELLSGFDWSPRQRKLLDLTGNDKRKKEILAREYVLTNIFKKEVEMLYGANNKPYIKNENYHISISHSGDFIGIMKSEKPCGLDIEIRAISLAVCRRMMSDGDFCCGDLTLKNAQILWTCKEATFKKFGENKLFLPDVSIQKTDQKHCFEAEVNSLKTRLISKPFETGYIAYTL